jgi:hypothetical protein
LEAERINQPVLHTHRRARETKCDQGLPVAGFLLVNFASVREREAHSRGRAIQEFNLLDRDIYELARAHVVENGVC